MRRRSLSRLVATASANAVGDKEHDDAEVVVTSCIARDSRRTVISFASLSDNPLSGGTNCPYHFVNLR